LPTAPIIPVFLSGGGGLRLWPLSHSGKPKQFLKLAGDQTLFQQALGRVEDPARFARPIVIGGAAHEALIREQLAEIGREADLILEPAARDTAPAVAAALLECAARDPSAMALVMPTDHAVGRREAFLDVVAAGATAAAEGSIVLFGILPDHPATGYGYIRPSEAVGPVKPVARFEEKPDARRASELIAEGCLWNSGMFLMPVRMTLEALERHAPDVLHAAQKAWRTGRRGPGCLQLDKAAFVHAPKIAIDRALMERTDRCAVAPVDMDWADLGSWSSLWKAGKKDASGAVSDGSVTLHDVQNVLVRAEGLSVTAIGVEDLIIVATPQGVLVAKRGRDEEVKALLDKMAASQPKAPEA
jgi:mannose-1-phosphate guanylyltransferase/mannose-1-phosphate guanylyltransferase/mannose-6-phosphate isomerase